MMNKASLRVHFGKMRAQAAHNAPDAGQKLAERLDIAGYCADIVAGYHAIRDELDPLPLLTRLQRAGACIALPRMDDSGTMQFCLADPARMESGQLGIVQPDSSCPVVKPDVIFAPLVACTRSGVRLGRGGGHYDRIFAVLDTDGHDHLRIGLAFDSQIADRLPCEPHDQLLHRVETPTQSIHGDLLPKHRISDHSLTT